MRADLRSLTCLAVCWPVKVIPVLKFHKHHFSLQPCFPTLHKSKPQAAWDNGNSRDPCRRATISAVVNRIEAQSSHVEDKSRVGTRLVVSAVHAGKGSAAGSDGVTRLFSFLWDVGSRSTPFVSDRVRLLLASNLSMLIHVVCCGQYIAIETRTEFHGNYGPLDPWQKWNTLGNHVLC